MKKAGRSKHSRTTVVKKKSSSGCLIIRKKAAEGFSSDSSSRSLSKKKRRRVAGSDSESESSGDSSSGATRHKFRNGSVGYSENREFGTEKNGLDVFEFDEYDDDGFEVKSNKKNDRWNLYRPKTGNKSSMFASSSSRPTTYGTTSQSNGGGGGGNDDDDDDSLPLSEFRKKYKLSSQKPIRLQGKNGVLKVMVNKTKQQMGRAVAKDQKTKLHLHGDAGDRKSSRSEGAITNKKNKSELKPNAGKSDVSRSKDNSHSRVEPVKHEEQVKDKTSSRVNLTEKQVLREKIKNMLIAAGWSIDYRPRRNRNYLDAVYISPAGTGYWSIIKAYDALEKEKEDEDEDNSNDGENGNFTPLPDEILGKLTRRTQKKKNMERELKRKRNNEGDEEEKENSYLKYGRKSRKISRCTLLVRGSDNKGLPNSENDGFVSYSGKRTLLSWLIDSGVVHINEHVEYMNSRKTKIMQKGWITKDGIHCCCCSKIVPVIMFEEHAGSKLGQPFTNIFLESGKSLMQCQIDAWNKQGELERKGFYTVDVDGEDPNDDTCGLCGDGGDLICCDGCPSTFHQSCLDIQVLPQGDWLCPNCSCKYCEKTCTEVGGKTEASLLMCCLCQKKYHESCIPEINVKPIESSYLNSPFCGRQCHEVYSRLQKLIGVKLELDSGFSWSLIHRSDSLTDASSAELSQRVECNSMLAVAMSVMDECFLPFTDRRSGINLIRNVVFNCGSNLSRLNYSGFFTAILERGDEVVCAASIRIHGTELAEMPFIGTRHMCRRQGICRRLLSALESALSSLQVEKLIIPAVAEHMHTWTDVFDFRPLEESQKQELRCMNMLVFPGTDMLQKPLKVVNQGKKDDPSKALSETISSDEVEKTEPGVPLDDDCCLDNASKETHPMNSNPDIPCEPKLSVSLDESSTLKDAKPSCESDVICEAKLQLPEQIKSVFINSNSSNNAEEIPVVQNKDGIPTITSEPDTSVEKDIHVQCGENTTSTDVVPCEPKPLVSVDESSTVQVADAKPSCESDVICEAKLHLPEKIESVSINSNSSNNAEEIPVVQNEDGIPTIASEPDTNAGKDIHVQCGENTTSTDVVPCEPKPSVSVDESSTVQVADAKPSCESDVICEAKLQLPEKLESVSINSNSSNNAEEIPVVQNEDGIPTISSEPDTNVEKDIHVQCGENTTRTDVVPCEPKPSVIVDESSTVQVADAKPSCESDVICEAKLQLPEQIESVSINSNSSNNAEEILVVQNKDGISTITSEPDTNVEKEIHVQCGENITSTDVVPCEPKPLVSVDESSTVQVVDAKPSCESDVICEAKLQLPEKIESVSINSNSSHNAEEIPVVQNEDGIPTIPSEPDTNVEKDVHVPCGENTTITDVVS